MSGTNVSTPMQAANKELNLAFVGLLRAARVWLLTLRENIYQKHLETQMFRWEPDLKKLVQLMQSDAEMRILVEIYADRLKDGSTESVYLDQEHKMQILCFCEKQQIKLNPRIFCHAWEPMKLVLNQQWIEDDGCLSIQVGNMTVFLWRRSYWREHVTFPVVLRDVHIVDVIGEDPDIHQLLERLKKEEEAKKAEEAKAIENAQKNADSTNTDHKPEQD